MALVNKLASTAQHPRLADALRSTDSYTYRFMQRLFLKLEEKYELATWQRTAQHTGKNNLPRVFFDCVGTFAAFVNAPTRENFDLWHNELAEQADKDRLFEGWNISKMLTALWATRYRDLDIYDTLVPIVSGHDVNTVDDTYHFVDEAEREGVFTSPNAFVTIVMGIAACNNNGSLTMEKLGEDILARAEIRDEEKEVSTDDEDA